MHRRHVLSALALVSLAAIVGDRSTRATMIRVGTDDRDSDDACERVTTTGRAVVRRRCEGTRTEVHVDNRLPVPSPRSTPREHERPIDRLRSRGEGRIRATGDKGARRELREKTHRGHGPLFSRVISHAR